MEPIELGTASSEHCGPLAAQNAVACMNDRLGEAAMRRPTSRSRSALGLSLNFAQVAFLRIADLDDECSIGVLVTWAVNGCSSQSQQRVVQPQRMAALRRCDRSVAVE